MVTVGDDLTIPADIVTRLRDEARRPVIAELLHEAADQIIILRCQLRSARETIIDSEARCMTLANQLRLARTVMPGG